MPRTSAAPAITVTTQEDIKLSPKLRKKLLTELKDIAILQAQIKEYKKALEGSVATVEEIRDEIGAKKFALEGFKIARVEGTQTYFDQQMCLDEGWLSATQIEEATKTKPKKPYTKISAPNSSDDE